MVTNHLRAPYGVYFTKKSYESTAPVRRPAGGRKNRTIFYQFFRHRTVPGEVHGARTAFGWVNEGKKTSAGHRTVPGRRPAGVCTHLTGTGLFLLKIYIVYYGHK